MLCWRRCAHCVCDVCVVRVVVVVVVAVAFLFAVRYFDVGGVGVVLAVDVLDVCMWCLLLCDTLLVLVRVSLLWMWRS